MKFIYVLIIASLAFTQNYSWNGFALKVDNFTSRVDSSTMFINDKAVGSWLWALKKDDAKLLIKDRSVLFGSVDETIEAKVSLRNTDEGSVQLFLKTARTDMEANIEFKTNKVKAKYFVNDREVNVDSVHENLRARLTALAVLPFLKLDEKTHRISLFSATTASIFKASLKASKNELLDGKSVTRVDLLKDPNGKGISNIIYISNTGTRRIVQVDVPAQNMKIKFTKSLKKRNLFH